MANETNRKLSGGLPEVAPSDAYVSRGQSNLGGTVLHSATAGVLVGTTRITAEYTSHVYADVRTNALDKLESQLLAALDAVTAARRNLESEGM